jgi:HD-GYP domain-containing protein (c-di-GMP phosphodiesterase class II)
VGGIIVNNDKSIFTTEEREIYERMNIPFAIYQVANESVETVLVSDGLCEMVGASRKQLIDEHDNGIYGSIHPDDREVVNKIEKNLLQAKGKYNVYYRAKLCGRNEYRFIQMDGKYTQKQKNRVFFLTYSDVTDTVLNNQQTNSINDFSVCESSDDTQLNRKKWSENEFKLKETEVLEANKHLHKAVKAERRKVETILVQTVLSISNALEAKDPYTCQHSERVARYASEIARSLKWGRKRIHDIYNISLVHDIGKIGIPDAVLMKPSALTLDEYERIKKHVEIGSNILKDFKAIDKIHEGILYHHERYDGKGYLFGLKGEEIPIEARIIGIADAVDAMYSTRFYREKQSVEYIVEELSAGRGKQFDPQLVDIMLHLINTGLLEE